MRRNPSGERPSRSGWVTAAWLALVAGCGGEAPPVMEIPEVEAATAAPAVSPADLAPVILISIDTLRADHLGCYGYTRATSPRIDRFRRDAVLFRQAIAQAPSTLPSHASMLTSLWPAHHGAFFQRKSALPPGLLTLAEVLAGHGYRTAGFHGGGQMAPEFGLGQGFEIYEGMAPTADTLDTARRARQWLETVAGEPFFLFFHTYEVHHPYTPEVETLRRFAPGYRGSLPAAISKNLLKRINRGALEIDERDLAWIVAAYDAEIRSMDAAVGALLDSLKASGLYDRSIIVVTSDHGEEFGERGKVGWHSHTLYDELLRVPLLIKLPSSRGGGASVAAQVRSIDLVPTLLSLLRLPPRPEFAGFDLTPLIEDPSLVPGLPAISQQDTGPDVDHTSLRAGRFKLYPNRLFQVHRLGAGAGRLRYLRARLAWALDRDQLFDLATDPDEEVDVADNQRATRKRLQALRERLLAEREAPPPVSAEPDAATLERLKALGYLD